MTRRRAFLDGLLVALFIAAILWSLQYIAVAGGLSGLPSLPGRTYYS